MRLWYISTTYAECARMSFLGLGRKTTCVRVFGVFSMTCVFCMTYVFSHEVCCMKVHIRGVSREEQKVDFPCREQLSRPVLPTVPHINPFCYCSQSQTSDLLLT